MNYIIYNPLAKNRISLNSIDDTTYYNCTNEQHMATLKEKLKQGDTITINGGDGTINYLLNYYSFVTNYPIKLYANGSANDFYESLTTDTFYYTMNNEYSFINTFGIGFDALVCKKTNEASNKGKFSYIKEAYKGIMAYKPFDLDITYNNKRHTYKKVWLCSLQNGHYFGGGINIARNANPNDEELDLCIAHNLGRLGVLMILLFVKLGLAHYFKKYFFTVKTKEVYIHNNIDLLMQLDGDVTPINHDLELTSIKHLDIKKTSKL